jgi:hypothetical protein
MEYRTDKGWNTRMTTRMEYRTYKRMEYKNDNKDGIQV